jgi:tRNA (cytidine/uridine-2'-O-)-methyltransferase
LVISFGWSNKSAAEMNVVLVEPEIPPNTGNIARLCAATRTTLHLIEPLGFKLDDSQLKRAGMDYWHHVMWLRWPDWAAFKAQLPEGGRLWFVEQGGNRRYDQAVFEADDYIIFGRETAGLPKPILAQASDRWIRIPMLNPEARSLNLSNCVALVLFEALRQQGFDGDITP